jgi:hypothetical protein
MQTDFGPARRSRAQWQALLARATRSSLSVAEFCRREGVSTASFYTWRRRLDGAPGQASTVAASACEPAFVDLGALAVGRGGECEGDSGAGWVIELDLGDGAVLRLRRR